MLNFNFCLKLLLLVSNKQWQPSTLELVTKEILDKYFAAVDDDDWEPLQLPPRSNLPNTLLKSKLGEPCQVNHEVGTMRLKTA